MVHCLETSLTPDDRVSVKRGRVLSELLPQRMIRLLPWKKAGHRPGVSIRGPVSLRAQSSADNQDRAASTTNPLLAAPAAPSPQLERVLAKVRAVPSTLTFSRRTISPDEPAMHGSLTIADVRDLLASQYQLTASEVEFAWSGNDPKQRIKELGSYGGKISVRGGAAKDAVEIVVEIVREA